MISMKSKSKFITAAICASLTALLIILIRSVDVAAIGPEGTFIGLSHINRFVAGLFGVNVV